MHICQFIQRKILEKSFQSKLKILCTLLLLLYRQRGSKTALQQLLLGGACSNMTAQVRSVLRRSARSLIHQQKVLNLKRARRELKKQNC